MDKKQTLLRLNLQHFAEDKTSEGETETPIPEETEGKEQDITTYTQEELDKALGDATKGLLTQEEVNAIVTERLERDRKKQEEERRLSQMNEDERQQEELRRTAKELEELKQQHEQMILEQDTIEVLAETGLPIEFKSFLMKEDAETTNENIKVFRGMFDAAIQDAVEERLKGKSPRQPIGSPKERDAWDEIKDRYKR